MVKFKIQKMFFFIFILWNLFFLCEFIYSKNLIYLRIYISNVRKKSKQFNIWFSSTVMLIIYHIWQWKLIIFVQNENFTRMGNSKYAKTFENVRAHFQRSYSMNIVYISP